MKISRETLYAQRGGFNTTIYSSVQDCRTRRYSYKTSDFVNQEETLKGYFPDKFYRYYCYTNSGILRDVCEAK